MASLASTIKAVAQGNTEVDKEEDGDKSQGFNPSSFLSEIINENVIVKLNSGAEYHGFLQSVDGYMNIALQDTDEVVNGNTSCHYQNVFIRGNNVQYIVG